MSMKICKLVYSLEIGMFSVSWREENHGKTDLHQPLHP